MGALLSYSLAASVMILVLYPILHLIVNRNTSFRFNRGAIICGLAASLLLPLLFDADVKVFPEAGGNLLHGVEVGLQPVAATSGSGADASAGAFAWVPVALAVYLFGVLVLLCREIISYIRLFSIIAGSERTKNEGIVICRINDERTAPFSWGNFILLHDCSAADESGSVYLHEKAHTDRRHWIDVLFADLFCILLWYNPFAWMTRQLMKLNHEFEADEAVINSGIETYDYQRLLVVKAMGNRSIPVANSFAADKRSFRKRVLIMSKKRSSRKTMLIALCAIPAVALAGAALSMPVPSRFLSDISGYSFRKELSSEETKPDPAPQDLGIESETSEPETETVTVIPSPFEDQEPLAEIIRYSVETIQPDKDTKVNINIVVDEDGRVKNVSSDSPDGAEVAVAISRKFNGVRLKQITYNGRPVEVRFIVPVHLKKKE